MGFDYRVGTGWDSHIFEPQRRLWLGGVEIAHAQGLAGHSDGDVLLHAICDAILGALGEGDIGTHFASNDPRWQGAASERFVRHAVQLAQRGGWEIVNVDANLILEQPRIQPLRERLRENVAQLLDVPSERISIKGKTPEGLGTAQAAIAQAVVLLHRSSTP
jgi:2-C-methyl-D-erythritol 2,4-cyclodiphosphate synthase